jgi:hypothetical protein
MDEQQKALSQQTLFRCDTSIDSIEGYLLSTIHFFSSTIQNRVKSTIVPFDFRTLAAKPEALIVLTLLATLSLRLSSK